MELKDILVVVDVQNDFVTGSLRNEEAIKVIPRIVNRVKEYIDAGKLILVTLDSHDGDYSDTQEGQALPIQHCMLDTSGRDLVPELAEVLGFKNETEWFNTTSTIVTAVIPKDHFGAEDLSEHIDYALRVTRFKKSNKPIEESPYPTQGSVEFIGLDTDCCVMANAITVRTILPGLNIWVNKDCCAGTTPEKHNMALELMKQYQIKS